MLAPLLRILLAGGRVRRFPRVPWKGPEKPLSDPGVCLGSGAVASLPRSTPAIWPRGGPH